jgi:hypothetical protein
MDDQHCYITKQNWENNTPTKTHLKNQSIKFAKLGPFFSPKKSFVCVEIVSFRFKKRGKKFTEKRRRRRRRWFRV